jgi:hypothetical protein
MAAQHDLVEAFNAQARASGWPGFCDPMLAFDQAELADFIAVWRAGAVAGAVPARAIMTARAIGKNLPKLLLFERVEAEEARRYRIRLTGTAIANILQEFTGRYIDDAIPAHLQPRWHAFIDLVLATQSPLRFVSRVDFQEKTFLTAEIAAVPLVDEEGRLAMVMCAIDFSSAKIAKEIAAKWRETATAYP